MAKTIYTLELTVRANDGTGYKQAARVEFGSLKDWTTASCPLAARKALTDQLQSGVREGKFSTEHATVRFKVTGVETADDPDRAADKAKAMFTSEQAARRALFITSAERAFEGLVNAFISDVQRIDVRELAIEFKDGSMAVVKRAAPWAEYGFEVQI